MTFGERLKDARKKKGLTQRQLADMTGTKHNSICNWEKGLSMPRPDTIQYMCWALGVEANYFFAEEEEAQPIPEAKDPYMSAKEIADAYDKLDDHGKDVINALMKLEVQRLQEAE